VLQLQQDDRQPVVGFVVDQVSDVVDIRTDMISPSPEFGVGVNTRFLRGLATVGQRMIMLLEVDRILHHPGRQPEEHDAGTEA
jgi:purine-binding chemotaxis protein CheW